MSLGCENFVKRLKFYYKNNLSVDANHSKSQFSKGGKLD